LDVALICVNYSFLAFWHHNILNWLIGQLLGGFYAAFVLIGNHEREKRYAEKPDVPFIDHQIITSRNYREDNLFWLLLMGGMQFQAEHHLFPQIPFYRLPAARKVIHSELSRLGKTLIYGPVIGK
jgi:acyl-lipid Delta6-acetylenase / acyl-lipid (9-3)-desaturase